MAIKQKIKKLNDRNQVLFINIQFQTLEVVTELCVLLVSIPDSTFQSIEGRMEV